MTHRPALAALAVTAAFVAVTACAAEKSYDEKITDCHKAVVAQADDDPTRPAACEDIKDKDYSTILLYEAAGEAGLIDENGNITIDGGTP